MYKKIVLFCFLLFALGLSEAKELLDKVVAVVNEEIITASELDKQVSLAKKQFLAQKMELPQDSILRKQVLQHLIDVNLQVQIAKQHKLSITDHELNQTLERIAAMNHGTLAQLQEEIARIGMDWQAYKENIRKDMLLSQLQQSAVGKEAFVSEEQVAHFLKTDHLPVNPETYTYHLQHIIIPLSEEPSAAEVQKAKKQAEYLQKESNKKDDFMQLAVAHYSEDLPLESADLGVRHLHELPDLFAKEVVKMKVGQVAGPLRAGNGFQLIKLVAVKGQDYQAHAITKTHVRHILLKAGANMFAKDSRKKINNIYQQLKSGKDFALMAKQYSLDTGSAVKGGDLGWVTAGEMVPEFEEAMNKLPLHAISQPVKTQFGWHLIQVLARKQQDDSEAFKKQQVRQLLQQRKFAEAVQNWQQHIRTEAYIHIVEKDLA